MSAVEVVGPDEAVAAFDVAAEVGECAFAEELHLAAECVGGFAFEDLEEEAEFCDLDGLAVDVDAVDVFGEDAFAFGGGEAPFDVRL